MLVLSDRLVGSCRETLSVPPLGKCHNGCRRPPTYVVYLFSLGSYRLVTRLPQRVSFLRDKNLRYTVLGYVIEKV